MVSQACVRTLEPVWNNSARYGWWCCLLPSTL